MRYRTTAKMPKSQSSHPSQQKPVHFPLPLPPSPPPPFFLKARSDCGVKILQSIPSVTVLFAYINIVSLRKTGAGTNIRMYVLIFVLIQISVCLKWEGWITGTHSWHKREADLSVFTLVVFSMALTWLTLATLLWKVPIDFANLKASLQDIYYMTCLNFLFWGPTFVSN